MEFLRNDIQRHLLKCNETIDERDATLKQHGILSVLQVPHLIPQLPYGTTHVGSVLLNGKNRFYTNTIKRRATVYNFYGNASY